MIRKNNNSTTKLKKEKEKNGSGEDPGDLVVARRGSGD